jgi:peptidyl-prolyl cis-trans isomerase SurA
MKNKLNVFILISASMLFSSSILAQTLFTINGKPTDVKEFERVYNKNNINNQADYSKTSLDEYLDLYVKFRLKVTEAEAIQLDTVPSLKNELATYRKQLAKNYLTDREVTDALVTEAYERLKYEVDASHILVLWQSEYPTAADSAKALKQINEIKAKIKGNNFGEIARKHSQDPSAKDNDGRLGYLTAFQTIYPFENAMYNTPVGKVSNPVATRFGYHLVFVHDKRPARGKMKTAHILIKSKETDSAENQKQAEAKAQEIFSEIKSGKISFEEAVKKYSEDGKTKFQNGELPELGSAEMMNSFADAAFSILEDGGIAPPVKTSIGWHIVKRISRTDILPFDKLEGDIKTRVSRDSRSNVANDKMIADTKVRFAYKANTKAKKDLFTAIQKSYANGNVNIENTDSYNQVLFSLRNTEFLQKDFIAYFDKNHLRTDPNVTAAASLDKLYTAFENQKITQYREDHLEEIDADFKNLVQEYRDGILLFELTNMEVWSKAVEDTAGLRAFHEQNKHKYMWNERLDYSTYTVNDEKSFSNLKKYVAKGWDSDKILAKLNKKTETTSVKHFLHEKSANDFVAALNWEQGVTQEEKLKDNKFAYTVVNSVRKPEPKKLNETRGYVISDYQDYLEKNWVKSLQEKHTVVVNQPVFNSLIK